MKKGISQWAFPADKPLKECFIQAKEAGFEAIEVAMDEEGPINLSSTKRQVRQVKKEAEDIGIELSSLATGLFWTYSLTSSRASVVRNARKIVRKMLEVASWLEVDTVLVVPGAVDVFFMESEVVPYDVVYNKSAEALAELAGTAAKYKVNIGIENVWNKFLLSPLEMKRFIDKIGSPYVGVYFDVGNVILTGYPEQWIRILGPRIKRVHFKDFKRSVGTAEGFVNLLYGDVDWPEVMNAFKAIGYDGYVVAELFPPALYPERLIYETSASMDKILGRI